MIFLKKNLDGFRRDICCFITLYFILNQLFSDWQKATFPFPPPVWPSRLESLPLPGLKATRVRIPSKNTFILFKSYIWIVCEKDEYYTEKRPGLDQLLKIRLWLGSPNYHFKLSVSYWLFKAKWSRKKTIVFTSTQIVSYSNKVWPDLAIFRHFGKTLKATGKY